MRCGDQLVSLPSPPLPRTKYPYNSICSVSTELNFDPLSVPTPMYPQYLHCGQFAMESALISLLLWSVSMNFLPSVLLKRDSYCLVHKSFGLSCLQSRSLVESCRLWAIWTYTRRAKRVCSLLSSSAWRHVTWFLGGTVHPFFRLLRGLLSTLSAESSCWPRLEGPSFEFSGSFT